MRSSSVLAGRLRRRRASSRGCSPGESGVAGLTAAVPARTSRASAGVRVGRCDGRGGACVPALVSALTQQGCPPRRGRRAVAHESSPRGSSLRSSRRARAGVRRRFWRRHSVDACPRCTVDLDVWLGKANRAHSKGLFEVLFLNQTVFSTALFYVSQDAILPQHFDESLLETNPPLPPTPIQYEYPESVFRVIEVILLEAVGVFLNSQSETQPVLRGCLFDSSQFAGRNEFPHIALTLSCWRTPQGSLESQTCGNKHSKPTPALLLRRQASQTRANAILVADAAAVVYGTRQTRGRTHATLAGGSFVPFAGTARRPDPAFCAPTRTELGPRHARRFQQPRPIAQPPRWPARVGTAREFEPFVVAARVPAGASSAWRRRARGVWARRAGAGSSVGSLTAASSNSGARTRNGYDATRV